MRNRRAIGCLLLMLLPVACVIGVPLAMRFQVWLTPAPHWVVDAADGTMHESCYDAAIDQDFTIQPVEDHPTAAITQSAAERIADRTIIKKRGWDQHVLAPQGSAPALIQIMLPNGENRLAWARTLVMHSGLLYTADIVYVDAQNGDPLVYVTDTIIGDLSFSTPSFGCSYGSTALFDDLAIVAIPTVLAVYGVLAAVIGGIIVLRRRAGSV